MTLTHAGDVLENSPASTLDIFDRKMRTTSWCGGGVVMTTTTPTRVEILVLTFAHIRRCIQ